MWDDDEDDDGQPEKPDLALLDLDRRRWVQFSLPVLVCVDVDEAGDHWVTHVVPMPADLGLHLDHAREPVVYDPDFDEPIENGYRADATARAAISHACGTQTDWVGTTRTGNGTGTKAPTTSPWRTASPRPTTKPKTTKTTPTRTWIGLQRPPADLAVAGSGRAPGRPRLAS